MAEVDHDPSLRWCRRGLEGHAFGRVKGADAVREADGRWRFHILYHCPKCDSLRHDYFNGRGALVYRDYDYSPGYLSNKGAPRLRADALRVWSVHEEGA